MDKNKKSGLAVAGLVLGIIAVVLAAIPIVNNFAFVLAVLALIFGVVVLVKKKGGRGQAIASIVLAVVAIVVVLVSQTFYGAVLDEATNQINDSMSRASGESTEELLQNDVDVTLGEFTVTEGEFIAETVLPVTVTNKVDEAKSYTIQIEAVTEDGTRIQDETVYANNLGANQTQEFEAFSLVTSDQIDALRAAEFRIVSVSQL